VFALRWPRSTPWIPVVAAVLVMCAWLQPVRVAAPVVSAGIEASVTPAEQQARADAAEASVAKALDTISDNPEAREQLKDMLAQMEQPPAGELSERDATAREADAAGRAALLEKHPDAIMLSAHAPGDVSALRETIIGFFEAAMVEDVLVLPYAKQGLIGEVYESARVLSETYDETGRVLQVRGLPGAIARLQRSLTAN
jgi:GTP-binding protein HflX